MKKSEAALAIRENVSLAPYTTLGVGGPARFLVSIKYENQIVDALDFAQSRSCPVFVLGGGSNVLVADSGFPGLVVRIEIRGVDQLDEQDSGFLSAAAGEEWDGFVQRCVEHNLAGIECLSGIPGTVGGAPVQNIGAYGQQLSDVVLSIRALNLETNDIEELSARDCRFGYRSSIFNTTCQDRYIILKVAFSLRTYGKPRIQYEDLKNHFAGRSKLPNIGEVRRTVIQIRESKGMLLQGSAADLKSAGSFFKNPVVDPDKATAIESAARDKGLLGPSDDLPRFSYPEGMEKLPAAWLIEHAGFHKGYTFGQVGISEKHALAFVNNGNALAREFVDLMHQVREKVFAEFGVVLQPEPKFLGFDPDFSESQTS